MSILNRLKSLFKKNKKPNNTNELEELDQFLIACEGAFFKNGIHHTLDSSYRKTFLVLLRLFYNSKNRDVKSRRHRIYTFYDELYKISNEEMQLHCDKYTIDQLLDSLAELPGPTRLGMALIINLILYIDKNDTKVQIDIGRATIAMLGIHKELYVEMMIGLKENNKFPSIDHIFIDKFS